VNTVGILHILCFEESVRNVWRNWLLKHSVPQTLRILQNLEFTDARFLLWSQKLR
jgi:hypothetical protein